MTKFRRQFDKNYKRPKLKGKWPKSVVRPDLGLTVRELMDRHTRYPDDILVPARNYTGDEEIPMDLDISEVKDMKDNLKANEEKAKRVINERTKKQRKEKQDKEFQQKLDEEVKKRSEKPLLKE